MLIACTTSHLITSCTEAWEVINVLSVSEMGDRLLTRDLDGLDEEMGYFLGHFYDCADVLGHRFRHFRQTRDWPTYPFRRMKTREVKEWFGTPESALQVWYDEAMAADYNVITDRFLNLCGHPNTDHNREIVTSDGSWALYHELAKIEGYVGAKIALHRAIETRKEGGALIKPKPVGISQMVMELAGIESALNDEF